MNHRVVRQCEHMFPEGAGNCLIVSPGQIGSTDGALEDEISRKEPSVDPKADAAGRVAGGVHRLDLETGKIEGSYIFERSIDVRDFRWGDTEHERVVCRPLKKEMVFLVKEIGNAVALPERFDRTNVIEVGMGGQDGNRLPPLFVHQLKEAFRLVPRVDDNCLLTPGGAKKEGVFLKGSDCYAGDFRLFILFVSICHILMVIDEAGVRNTYSRIP